MKMFSRSLIALNLTLALGACNSAPPSAYQIRSPESLLVTSSDLVSVDLNGKNHLDKLSDAIKKNPPSRAVLNCPADGKACQKAERLLAKHKIATESTGAGSSVTLVYDHVEARDCNQRYVDNSRNELNLNYPALGCSISGNMVQMVTDKRQFTDPSLLGYRDGEKTAAAYDDYLNPSAPASSGTGYGSGATGMNSLIPTSTTGGSQ